MGKSKKKSRKRGFYLALPIVSGVGAALAEPIADMLSGNLVVGFNKLAMRFTGFDPVLGNWNPYRMVKGVVPVAVGLGVHKLFSMLGFNRALGQSGIPVIRM